MNNNNNIQFNNRFSKNLNYSMGSYGNSNIMNYKPNYIVQSQYGIFI